MDDKTTVVLLIEDDPADARLIREALSAEIDSPFRVEWVDALAISEARFQAMSDASPLGILTYLNRVAEQMTGWPWQDASGRPLAEVFSVIDGTTGQPARNPAQRAVHQNRS